MSYTALYRKHRPKTFSDVVGQPHITTTLKNAIASERISHAYLFCGARGTGKTSTAKIFARAVNCLTPDNGNPCNQCDTCKDILSESIMDVMEIDAASNNSVDNVRQIRDDVAYSTSKCKYKVYIIDEVHMLSSGAFNALLKTLEEPPAHVIFIMATTEPQKIPATIHSRCMRFDFKKISSQSVLDQLKNTVEKDGIKVSAEGLEIIAKKADGSMRDALSLLDQCVGAEDFAEVSNLLGLIGQETLYSMADCIAHEDFNGVMVLINRFITDGGDIITFINDMTEHMRNLLLCKITKKPDQILDIGLENVLKLKEQSESFTREKLINCIKIFSDSQSSIRWVNNQRIVLEMALTRMCNPYLENTAEALEDRLAGLENRIKNLSLQPLASSEQVPAIKTHRQESPKPQPPIPIKANQAVEAVKKNKDKILDAIKHIGAACEFLNGAEIKNYNEGLLFEVDCDIKLKILKKNQDAIEKAIQDAIGGSVPVKYGVSKEGVVVEDRMEIKHIENFEDPENIIQINE